MTGSVVPIYYGPYIIRESIICGSVNEINKDGTQRSRTATLSHSEMTGSLCDDPRFFSYVIYFCDPLRSLEGVKIPFRPHRFPRLTCKHYSYPTSYSSGSLDRNGVFSWFQVSGPRDHSSLHPNKEEENMLIEALCLLRFFLRTLSFYLSSYCTKLGLRVVRCPPLESHGRPTLDGEGH